MQDDVLPRRGAGSIGLNRAREDGYATALQLWRPLADKGSAAAQSWLGFMYYTPHGVPQDYAEAAKWFRLAADQGLAYAQFNLGVMYANGEGMPRDYILAYKWFSMSAAKGNKEAVKDREDIAEFMTPAQIAEAQKLAPAVQARAPAQITNTEADMNQRAVDIARHDPLASRIYPVKQRVNLPTPESGNYSQLCNEKWTKRGVLDSNMFNYCMSEQADGDRTLAHLVAQYSSVSWMQQVIDAAVEKWTKRGMREENMVAYETSQQIDAYLNVEYASHRSGFQSDTLQWCYAKWEGKAPNWVMAEYCYKQATGTD
jgi:TPR repeat protein